MDNTQSTTAVLMVRPDGFGFDEQTAATNTFQNDVDLDRKEVNRRAISEFEAMVTELNHHDIRVVVFSDQDNPAAKPNAVFPNNWLSMWPDGRVYLYPMATESRRGERSFVALEGLRKQFRISDVVDITGTEAYGYYLESTGALIFDHEHKLVYACSSPRCDASLFTSHAVQLGYVPILFEAADRSGTAIYHTNVMMGVQSTTAVICAEAITDIAQRATVLQRLEQSGHEVVQITQEQMAAFCGNVLELRSGSGERFLAMSKTAYEAFTPEQREILGRDKTLLAFDVSTIEKVGGGSVRCMLAEIFLPHK